MKVRTEYMLIVFIFTFYSLAFANDPIPSIKNEALKIAPDHQKLSTPTVKEANLSSKISAKSGQRKKITISYKYDKLGRIYYMRKIVEDADKD
ncbi:hypothetical protein [Desulforegula conservatrix]|uniref:hypothetical protein n=1 Tax=Desulforegula conservatrix TaxID=153026 RepID=UPI0004296ACD|nr:hypothetical protein [Desulforegula conservatrix]